MAPGHKEPQEEREIDPYMMLVIETTSQKTVTAFLKQHKEECSINNLKREFYGDGTDTLPGVKADVRELKTDVKDLKECKRGFGRFIRDQLLAPVVTAVIVAALMAWLFHK